MLQYVHRYVRVCVCHTTPMFVQALCTLLCNCKHSVSLCLSLCVCVCVSKGNVNVSETSVRWACRPAMLCSILIRVRLAVGLPVCLPARPPAWHHAVTSQMFLVQIIRSHTGTHIQSVVLCVCVSPKSSFPFVIKVSHCIRDFCFKKPVSDGASKIFFGFLSLISRAD